jgi:SAM-dependent methyltransferase
MQSNQRISRWLKTQFGRPSGFWGSVAGAIMANRSSNRERARWTVELLDLKPGERVLEVGFGPGTAIERIVRSGADVAVVGIDHSQVMFRQASRRNAAAIEEGRVQLQLASVQDLPELEVRFHKIFAINSVGFWPDPVARLTSLRERLVPGGTLVLTVQPRGVRVDETVVARTKDRLSGLMGRAGFDDVRVAVREMRGAPAIATLGRSSSG